MNLKKTYNCESSNNTTRPNQHYVGSGKADRHLYCFHMC